MRKYLFALLLLFAATFAAAKDNSQGWVEVRSPHFVVMSNASEKQARHTADQFERMREVFHAFFPNMEMDSVAPILVLAVKDEKDFRALEPAEYLGKGKLNLAGLFLQTQDKNYILLRLDAEGEHPFSVIYHEYTHFLARKTHEWLPLWLNEGLAEFFQNTDIRDKDVLMGEPSSDNLRLLRQNHLIPLATLLTVDHNSPYYHEENKGSIFYAECWALTHFFEIRDQQEHVHRLIDYAQLVSQKVDSVTAATRVFGDLQKLQRDLENYVTQNMFQAFVLPAAAKVNSDEFKSRTMTLIQTNAVRADFLVMNGRVADARPLLDAILKEDPNNVDARETLGSLAFREGHMEEARKWYGEAIKLDSQSYLAQFYWAAISMNSNSMSPEEEAQAEKSLRAAIKLNPSFAPAYDRLAIFYGGRHQNLEEAHILSVQACQLDPANLGYRFNTATILMAMERGQDAVAVLKKAVNLATSPEKTARLQTFVDQIQNYLAARERVDQYNKQISEASSAAHAEVKTDMVVKQDDNNSDPGRPVLARREDLKGPRKFISGTIKHVQCSDPALISFSVTSNGQVTELSAPNYYKVNFTALNFAPTEELNPCKQLEGLNAKVEFIQPPDKSIKGQIVSVEMRK